MRMTITKVLPSAIAPTDCEHFQYSQAQFWGDHIFMTLVQLWLSSMLFAAQFLDCDVY